MLDHIETISRSHPERREATRSTRDKLVQEGLRQVQENGWAATGIDAVLRQCKVPKGSFYHYFASKEAFGYALLESYQSTQLQWLAAHLVLQPTGSLEQLCAALDGLVDDRVASLQQQGFKRSCLLGAMGQEVAAGHDGFRLQLLASLQQWEKILSSALFNCSSSYANDSDWGSDKSKTVGLMELQNQCQLLAQEFWVAWQGAQWHSVLVRNPQALRALVKRLQDQMVDLTVAQRSRPAPAPAKLKPAKSKPAQSKPAQPQLAQSKPAKKAKNIAVVQKTLDF